MIKISIGVNLCHISFQPRGKPWQSKSQVKALQEGVGGKWLWLRPPQSQQGQEGEDPLHCQQEEDPPPREWEWQLGQLGAGASPVWETRYRVILSAGKGWGHKELESHWLSWASNFVIAANPGLVPVFSSPELKTQVNFSDRLSSVVCLSVCLSVRL